MIQWNCRFDFLYWFLASITCFVLFLHNSLLLTFLNPCRQYFIVLVSSVFDLAIYLPSAYSRTLRRRLWGSREHGLFNFLEIILDFSFTLSFLPRDLIDWLSSLVVLSHYEFSILINKLLILSSHHHRPILEVFRIYTLIPVSEIIHFRLKKRRKVWILSNRVIVLFFHSKERNPIHSLLHFTHHWLAFFILLSFLFKTS